MKLTRWQVLITGIFSVTYILALCLGKGQKNSLIIALTFPVIFLIGTMRSGQITKAIISWKSAALFALYFSALFAFGLGCQFFLIVLRPGVGPDLLLFGVNVILFMVASYFIRIVARKFQLTFFAVFWHFFINGALFCAVWSIGTLVAK